MNKQTSKVYQQFRSAGFTAKDSLSNAKTLIDFQQAESAGLVRIIAEPEQESYFAVFGEPEGYEGRNGKRVSAEQERKELEAQLDDLGCWCVQAEVKDAQGEWQQVESVGMCSGYQDPCSPFENCYAIGFMRVALNHIPQDGQHDDVAA